MDESDMNEREIKKTPEICCDTITNNNNNSKSLDHQLIFPN